MTQKEKLRFILTGDPEGGRWPDDLLDGLLESAGFNRALLMLAEGEIRRLEEEPSQITEEGGLSVKYQDRTRQLRETARRCREEGFGEEPASMAGASRVWEEEIDL